MICIIPKSMTDEEMFEYITNEFDNHCIDAIVHLVVGGPVELEIMQLLEEPYKEALLKR